MRAGCVSEKWEAGFHARIVEETAHREATAEINPAMAFDQSDVQSNAVQGITGMEIGGPGSGFQCIVKWESKIRRYLNPGVSATIQTVQVNRSKPTLPFDIRLMHYRCDNTHSL